MPGFTVTGNWAQTSRWLRNLADEDMFRALDSAGQAGVSALSAATPVDSSLTANSWDYTVTHAKGKHTVEWFNTNENAGANIAILIQYGHGTGTGGYVPGKDYINPAMKPIFDKIIKDVLSEVK